MTRTVADIYENPQPPPMRIGTLRNLIHDLPDSATIEITNLHGAEWYGIEPLDPGAVAVIDGKLVIDFGNCPPDDGETLETAYREQQREDAAREIATTGEQVRDYVLAARECEDGDQRHPRERAGKSGIRVERTDTTMKGEHG